MKKAIVEFKEEKPFQERLKEALEGTGVSFDEFIKTVAQMVMALPVILFDKPKDAADIINHYTGFVFGLGIKYGLEHSEEVKVIYVEE